MERKVINSQVVLANGLSRSDVPTQPLARISDVHFAYQKGVPVLNGVSFCIERGVLTGIIGSNGAGKTTLVRLIRGELKPIAGKIEFLDADGEPRSNSKIAVVEQHLSLFPDLSVAANICLESWVNKGLGLVSPNSLRDEAKKAIARLGVQLDVNVPVGTLPYPSQQMVEIARAVYQGANLLILDEPTAALDTRSRDRLLEILKCLAATGTSVLLVTHDMDDLQNIADKVLEMTDGRIAPVRLDDKTDRVEKTASFVSGKESRLVISVRLPFGQVIELSGQFGCTTVWYFDDALERNLTARAIAFPDEPTSCRVKVDNAVLENVLPSRLRTEGIRLLLSNRRSNSIFPDLTVSQNYLLVSGSGVSLLSRQQTRSKVRDALKLGNVRFPSLDAPVSTLSGGNQQRLLWRALTDSGARFIIAEEPLLGLDPLARQMALDQMREISESGRGVIVLTCFARAYAGCAINIPQKVSA